MDNLATHIANLQIVDHDNDINPWVERFVRYCSMYDKALDPLRENLSRNLFIRYYTEGVVQWAEEERTDPRIVFSPEDQQAQEMFYHVIDDICATFDTAKKDDWKTLVRISIASQAGFAAVSVPGNQFPVDSKHLREILKQAVPKMQAVNKKLIEEREAAQWLPVQNAPSTTNPHPVVS